MACYVQKFRPPSQAEFVDWQKIGFLGGWEDYCRIKADNAGGSMMICGDFGEHCADCAGIGDFLCDFPVGEGKTCDRPMCVDHAHEIGPELHYCEAHYRMWEAFKNSGGVDSALRNVIAFKPEK